MTTLNKIEKEINEVKEWNMDAGNELHTQLSESLNSSNSFDDLSEIIKEDNDVADKYYSQDDGQHAEIRNIQDAIINFCAE